MKRTTRIFGHRLVSIKFLCCVLLFLNMSVNLCLAQTLQPEYLPGVLMVKFKDETALSATRHATMALAQEQVLQAVPSLGSKRLEPVWKAAYSQTLAKRWAGKKSSTEVARLSADLERTYYLRYEGEVDPAVLARQLSQLPGVAYAEPRYVYHMMDMPNDPFVLSGVQDHFAIQHFYEAWDVTTGSEEVVIAFIDSGVDYTHPDLRQKLWTNPGEIPNNGIDDDGNGYVDDDKGWDFQGSGTPENPLPDNDPLPDLGERHGTFTSGIAAAHTNNGIGGAGTGYQTRYMSLRTPSAFFGYEAILYATLMGADVASNSWGSRAESEFGRDVVNMAMRNGTVVVAAAGNQSSDVSTFPGSYVNTLSVASIEHRAGQEDQASAFTPRNQLRWIIWIDLQPAQV